MGQTMRQDAAGDKVGMDMTPRVTRPQLVAVTLLTVLALAGGTLLAALFGDFRMRASDMQGMGGMTDIVAPMRMNGLVMPPGMIMTADMALEALQDMAAVDPAAVTYTAPADARGDQPLQPRLDNGVKVFDLTTAIIRWNILPDRQVLAYAVNRQVPGPRIRVTEGDRVRMIVTNRLPDPTTIHWHGLTLPNGMDGAGDVTQPPIAPGASFTYEFTVEQAGSYFYHSHTNPDRQQGLGLYGALLVDPKDPTNQPVADKEAVIQLQEWTVKSGYTFPAMPMEGAMPNFFTINGKAYPSTERITMRVGERLRVRFIGTNSGFIHPMHIHGGPFTIVATDGNPVVMAHYPSGASMPPPVVAKPRGRVDFGVAARPASSPLVRVDSAEDTVGIPWPLPSSAADDRCRVASRARCTPLGEAAGADACDRYRC